MRKSGGAVIQLFSINGIQILNQALPAGAKEIKLDLSALQQGIYFFEIRENKHVVQRGKVLLLK